MSKGCDFRLAEMGEPWLTVTSFLRAVDLRQIILAHFGFSDGRVVAVGLGVIMIAARFVIALVVAYGGPALWRTTRRQRQPVSKPD